MSHLLSLYIYVSKIEIITRKRGDFSRENVQGCVQSFIFEKIPRNNFFFNRKICGFFKLDHTYWGLFLFRL